MYELFPYQNHRHPIDGNCFRKAGKPPKKDIGYRMIFDYQLSSVLPPLTSFFESLKSVRISFHRRKRVQTAFALAAPCMAQCPLFKGFLFFLVALSWMGTSSFV